MKLPITLFSLCLAVIAAAQADSGLQDSVKDEGAPAPAPPKVKAPIPLKVDNPPKPPIKPAAKPPSSLFPCKYSCPLRDTVGTPLAKKLSAFGWDFDGYFVKAAQGRAGKGKGETKGKGWYDIFECVYALSTAKTKEHTCSYYKHDGIHALELPGDNCPSQAPVCPDSTSSPLGVPVLGLTAQDDEESTTSSTPHFSSSQLDGAELDSVSGVYKYADILETPPWVQGGRHNMYLKEHPPVELN